MPDFYILRDPVPNSYKLVGLFTDGQKEKIRRLTGIVSVTKMTRDAGINVITDGKVRFNDLLPQITILTRAN